MAAALLTATACAAGGASAGAVRPVAARQAHASRAAKPAANPVDVLSVSFASPSAGWLLAEHGQRASRVLVRKTVDGGRTWVAAPSPQAPGADASQSSPPPTAVGSILFTSARDGWAFGPALWRTTDGGATWAKERAPGPVADLAVADGRMLVVTGRAGGSGQFTSGVYAAAVGTDNWRPVPGTAMTGLSAPALAVSGRTGYLSAGSPLHARVVLLAGPVTGSGRWRSLSQPCAAAWSPSLAAAPGGWLFIGCGGEPGAGNQLKTAYLSRDGGRTWHRVASPPFGGYLDRATMSPGGTIFLSGQRMDVYISGDRGRSWQQSPSLAGAAGLANAGFSLVATTVTNTFGVAIEEGVSTRQVWLTTDGGRRWTPVTVH
jgi:photosystem II stability/assembly factor-like uncharacterized protein